MKTIATLLFTLAVAWTLGLWLPYWSLSLAALLVGFLMRPGAWKALLAGLLAGALLWGGMAYVRDVANAHILATRIGTLFGMGAPGMVGITAALGAVLAGLGTLLGDRIRNAVS